MWQLSEKKQINVCSQLDWKRSLAIHLWYLLPPTASISRALSMYEEAFQVYVASRAKQKSCWVLCFCQGNPAEKKNPIKLHFIILLSNCLFLKYCKIEVEPGNLMRNYLLLPLDKATSPSVCFYFI